MEVRGLSFAYGRNKVLKDVSLKIEEGKITTIMGANGCGKSTLFSLINLFSSSFCLGYSFKNWLKFLKVFFFPFCSIQ